MLKYSVYCCCYWQELNNPTIFPVQKVFNALTEQNKSYDNFLLCTFLFFCTTSHLEEPGCPCQTDRGRGCPPSSHFSALSNQQQRKLKSDLKYLSNLNSSVALFYHHLAPNTDISLDEVHPVNVIISSEVDIQLAQQQIESSAFSKEQVFLLLKGQRLKMTGIISLH